MSLNCKINIRRSTLYIKGSSGYLYTIYFAPENETNLKGHIIVCPPFAEEMNKSRHSMVLFAIEAAKTGYGVLLIDLFGTGDSQGDFVDARWENWLADINTAYEMLINKGAESIIILGVRLGCLLAIDAYSKYKWNELDKLVFWQPVINGDVYINQFLRLRMAADFISQKEKTSTQELKEQLDNGLDIEVAGYMLNSELYQALCKKRFADYILHISVPLDWYEIVSNLERELTVIAKKIIENTSWLVRPEVQKIKGEQFWATPEISIIPELISKTAEKIAQVS